MSRALPTWTADLVPVDMDGAAKLLGISRRFITVVSVFPGGHIMEQFLHKAFAPLRVHGEWFEEKGDLAQLISTIEALK